MIPVAKQPEPENFDRDVRQPGQKWLEQHHSHHKSPEPYWSKARDSLYKAYNAICAYYSYRIYCASEATIDHFIPKSQDATQVYEWNNYRLASLAANRLKRDHSDILDPFTMQEETFHLNLLSGEIVVNPGGQFDSQYKQLAHSTIDRLQLNSPRAIRMRLEAITAYCERGYAEEFFPKIFPFIYMEIVRQR